MLSSAEGHDSSSIDRKNESKLAAIYEEFEALRNRGEISSYIQFAARYPDYANELRDLFQMVELAKAAQNPGTIPRNISNYELKNLIGQGGMGVVYRASHKKLVRDVAIKLIPLELDKKNQYAQRFEREAKLAAGLEHPNIVGVFDYGIDDGIHWLAMRLVDGHDLSQPNVRNRFADSPEGLWWQIAKVGAQVASGLAYAHRHGVIHRDIKPSNLLLDDENQVHISDFGLATFLSAETDLSNTRNIIGTPNYMAPEQIRGLACEQSDIYSLGITLWELATGQRAWDDSSEQQRKSFPRLVPVREVQPLIPEELARTIDKACAAEIAHRYQTADDLKYDLNRFAHQPSAVDRRRNPRSDSKAKNQNNKIGTLAIYVAGVVFCFAAIVAALLSTSDTLSKAQLRELQTQNTSSDVYEKTTRTTAEMQSAPNHKDQIPFRLTNRMTSANFWSKAFIQFPLPIRGGLRDGLEVQIVGGRDADKLIGDASLSNKNNKLRLMLRPDVAPDNADRPLKLELNLKISDNTYQETALLIQPKPDSENHVFRIERDSEDDARQLLQVNLGRNLDIVDIASSDGTDFFVLSRQENTFELLHISHQHAERIVTNPRRTKVQLAPETKAIATSDGKIFFVLEEHHDKLWIKKCQLQSNGELSESSKLCAPKPIANVEALATVDGKRFSIHFGRKSTVTCHMGIFEGTRFQDSQVRFSLPWKRKGKIASIARWRTSLKDARSTVETLLISLNHSSEEFQLTQAVSQRHLVEDNKRNVTTARNKSRWRLTYQGTSENGNKIVFIRNSGSGRYLDDDFGSQNVDTSLNTDDDQQWELIPLENGNTLFKNRATRQFLHQEPNHNVKTSAKLDKYCEWVMTPIQ